MEATPIPAQRQGLGRTLAGTRSHPTIAEGSVSKPTAAPLKWHPLHPPQGPSPTSQLSMAPLGILLRKPRLHAALPRAPRFKVRDPLPPLASLGDLSIRGNPKRSPLELSCCMETLLPMHNATATALMTSMLSVSLRGYGRLSEEDGDHPVLFEPQPRGEEVVELLVILGEPVLT